MRDSGPPSSWRWIGRMLPCSLRELMFEPFCDDLWRAHVTDASSGRLRLWLHFVGGFTAAVAYSIPRYFVERNRITVLGRLALVMATGVTVLAVATLTPWVVFLAKNL